MREALGLIPAQKNKRQKKKKASSLKWNTNFSIIRDSTKKNSGNINTSTYIEQKKMYL
jgi:hypothetical protein